MVANLIGSLVFLFVMLVLIAIPPAVYAIGVRNDLARRWTRLLGLAANIRAVRGRRQGVGRDVARHETHAQRHERHVTRSGSQRGRGGGNGRLVGITDTSNGWPTAGTTALSGQAMGVDVQSRDTETAARLALHNEAEEYNAILRSWPSCLVAQAAGFRPWQYSGSRRKQQRKW